jgi:hypothetical protein
LTFPNRQTDINWILELREMELKRFVITIWKMCSL